MAEKKKIPVAAGGKEVWKQYRFLLKPTLILFAVYMVAMTAIIRANFYYYDDIQRALWGGPTWGFSRYISMFFSRILHAGSYLADISPLPQTVAMLIIALSSAMVIHAITGEKEFSFWNYIAVIPFGLSPHFLECLSYKYDPPYMALSLFFSVLPLIVPVKRTAYRIGLTAVGIIGMCTSYQASAGLYPMLVILLGLRRWVRGEKTKEVLGFYLTCAAGYFLGLIVFHKFLLVELTGYVSTNLAPLNEMLSCAVTNYKRYIIQFLSGYNPEWLAAGFLICVCFLWRMVWESRQNKAVTFGIAGILMVLMFLLSFGVYPFLSDPLFYPRAMYGGGCFLAFVGVFASAGKGRRYGVAKIACLVLSWSMFVFAFVYGNALDVQAKYTDYRITEVVDDLLACDPLPESNATLQVTGTIGYAPGLENMIKEYPMIGKLVPVTFIGDGWWGEFGLRYYYALPVWQLAETYDPPQEELPLIVDTYLHTIRADEDYIWIDLH